jgi:hypothetical protein
LTLALASGHAIAFLWGQFSWRFIEEDLVMRRREVVETPKERLALARDAGIGRVSVASAFAGTLAAFGGAVLLLAMTSVIAAGSDLDERLADASWREAGAAGGIILAGVLFVSYAFGGYSAGRMARRSGLMHGVLVFLTSLVGLAVVTAVAQMLTDASTDAVMRNLRSVGVPTNGDEWRDVVSAAGIGSLAAMFLGSCLGGLWGDRWHNRLLARALDPAIGEEGEVRARAASVHEDAVGRVERTRVGGGVDLRDRLHEDQEAEKDATPSDERAARR